MKLRWRWPKGIDFTSIGCYVLAIGVMSHYDMPVIAQLAAMLLIVFGSVLAREGNRV